MPPAFLTLKGIWRIRVFHNGPGQASPKIRERKEEKDNENLVGEK